MATMQRLRDGNTSFFQRGSSVQRRLRVIFRPTGLYGIFLRQVSNTVQTLILKIDCRGLMRC